MASPLFVSRFGQGKPIVCLHGIEAHGVRYVGLASYMPGYEIVAPDLRGHGRSTRSGPFSVEQQVDDVVQLLEETGPETTLLGHSFGGRIAWEVARAAPDKVARLVLVDPPLEVDPDFARRSVEGSPIHLRWSDRATAFNAMAVGRRAEALWSVALDAAVGLEPTDDGQLRVAVEEAAVIDCWNRLTDRVSESQFRKPTLLVEARLENGAFVTPRALVDLRRQLGANLRHEVLGLPHTITADGPKELAALVVDFIGRN